MFTELQQNIHRLRPSERSVADYVSRNAQRCVTMSMRELSEAVGVSEPTIMRFCHALNCDGFQSFKIQLAQDLARSEGFLDSVISPDDSILDMAQKVVDRNMASLKKLRDQLDEKALSRAIDALSNAERIELYGLGGSGNVALEAQQKLFRLGTPVVAYIDPYTHNVAASLLNERAVVIVISHSGQSIDIIRSAQLARDKGAIVIALSPNQSALANIADININIRIEEDSDYYAPFRSRLAQHSIIDTLVVGIGLRKDNNIVTQLRMARQNMAQKFLSSESSKDLSVEASNDVPNDASADSFTD